MIQAMNRETKVELINQASSLVGLGLKEWLVHRKERQIMEAEKEHRMELAQARADAMARREGERARTLRRGRQRQSALERASDVAQEYHDLLAEARDEEHCGLCRDLIERIEDEPLSVQHRALPELKVLKERADRGASQDELRRFIEDSDVLQDIITGQARDTVQQEARSQGLDTESRRGGDEMDEERAALIDDETRQAMLG